MHLLQKILTKIQTAWSMFGIGLLLLFVIDTILERRLVRRFEGQFTAYLHDYPDPDHAWIDQYIRDAIKGERIEWRPYVYWRRLPNSGETFKVDTSGLRQTWTAPRANGEKVLRIFGFGGSTMWGTGSRADYNLPSWLSRHLSDAGQKVEVTNFGENGYVSTQELLTLYLELRNHNVPDVVVFYDGINDAISAFQNKKAGYTANESNRFAEFNADEKRSLVQKFISVFPSLVHFTTELGRRFAKPYTITEADGVSLEKSVVDIYRENVRFVEMLGREYGFRTLFYWQPTIFSKDTLASNEVRAASDFEYMRAFLTGAYAAIKGDRTLASDPCFHDLSDLFRKTDFGVFADTLHISERGNSIVAMRIAKDIEQEFGGRSPGRSPAMSP
jgi:lysophospholipase L1-like esterase